VVEYFLQFKVLLNGERQLKTCDKAMSKNWKVVVTARAFWVSGQSGKQLLEDAGCEVVPTSVWGPLKQSLLAQDCSDADAVIAATDLFSRAIYDACPKLKIVARCGVGIDSVNLQDSSDAGIVITNTPGAMTEAVADYCFALLLGIVRHIPQGLQCMQRGEWTEFPGIELSGKTLGVVGFGMIGQAVMRRGIGFGMKILAHDPPLVETGRASQFPDVEFVDLDTLLSRSRVVSIHAPNIAETRHLINAHRLSLMSPDAYLVNTSRGSLIDEKALMDALHAGRIAGAAIDVYEQEPLPSDHPLRSAPRLLLTPHNAFNSVEASARMSFRAAQSIVDLKNGKLPEFVCNPNVFTSKTPRWKINAIDAT
jgi:phosphoglycerate dehydrogenase-like enzyme